jgi:hypothetical protein
MADDDMETYSSFYQGIPAPSFCGRAQSDGVFENPLSRPPFVTFSTDQIDAVARFFDQRSGARDSATKVEAADNVGIRHVFSGLGNLFHAIAASSELTSSTSDFEMRQPSKIIDPSSSHPRTQFCLPGL